jgi:membrane-bound metal-dependent hydrolase YbcI (DUF457 family)
MLLLAHTGITLGAAALVAKTVPGDGASKGWFVRLGGWLDIRLLLVGAMLPDIIDKPLGIYLLPDTFGSGRIYAHTLLFLLLLTGIGFWLFKARQQRWMLALAAGTFMHIVLDEIWNRPVTLFWPLLGTEFTRVNIESWLGGVFGALWAQPKFLVAEIIGLAVLVWFLVWLLHRRVLAAFIRYGRVE